MDGILNFKIRSHGGKPVIHAHYRLGRKIEVRSSTGKQLESAKSWDEKRQRIKNLLIEKNSASINQWLTKRHALIDNEITALQLSNPDYTRNHIKTILKVAFGKASDAEKATQIKKELRVPSLLELYAWYITHFSVNPTPTTQKPLALSSIKTFKSTKTKFIEFCGETKCYDYHDIDMEFYELFTNWLRSQNYSANYIGSHIKNLKTVMNYGFTRGYHTSVDFKKREFAKPKEDIENIYLNDDELKRMAALELPKNLDHSRDIFLIGAYTGLRISDLNRLDKKHINSTQQGVFIEIQSKKTKQRIVIPCNTIVKNIFLKYENQPPPYKSEQKINKDLKKIAEKAKINETVFIERTIGGQLIRTEYKKYELISNHSSRRSFCSNAYNAGMHTYDIMAISGHKTERMFYSYIKATSKEKAVKISQHPFFK